MQCPNCKTTQVTRIHDKVWSIENGQVFRCDVCDLGFIDPIMSDEEEAAFYKNFNQHVKNRGMTPEVSIEKYHQKSLAIAKERWVEISSYFKKPNVKNVLEIGSSTGAFLSLLNGFTTSAVEVSDENRIYSQQFVIGDTYTSIDEVPADMKFHIICMFHVFEHMKNPFDFLEKCKALLEEDGIILIEVPHIEDPLMSLYDLDAFRDFVFQPMHPMIYSKKSLDYVFERSGLRCQEVIYYQRYGLGNHLGWLKNHKPGGDPMFNAYFEDNESYKQKLVELQKTDTIFYIATKVGK